MRVLLALALLLLWASTDAHHNSEHNLKGPLFMVSQTQRYEFSMNMTAGIPGLTSQVSKAVIQAIVNIRPKSNTEFLVKIEDVRTNRPEASVSSDEDYIPLTKSSRLESDLSKPFKFTIRDGLVESYYLDKSESRESQQIKRSILRHFQVKLHDRPDEEIENSVDSYPYIYNITKETRHGPVRSYYTVNVSPNPEYPYEQNVYNISKTESYDHVGYPAYHEHHNFVKQGCPEVCKQQWDDEMNKYGAECPLGYEPHHTPLKLYTSGHYNLYLIQDRMVLENAYVEEKHIASMYDQDMVITISAEYNLKDITDKRIEEPRDGKLYSDLDVDIEPEHEESSDIPEEVSFFKATHPSLRSSEATSEVERLLKEISETIIRSDIEGRESQEIGEKLILLQKALTILQKPQLDSIWRNIVNLNDYRNAEEEEKIKRQLLMDLMPLCGSEECVEFMVHLIKEKHVSIWESKEMLIAIPENVISANERNIKNLYSLLEVSHVQKQHLLHSASHLALSRVINKACVTSWFRNASAEYDDEEPMSLLRTPHMKSNRYDDDEDEDDTNNNYDSAMNSRRQSWRKQHSQSRSSVSSAWTPAYECPKSFVNRYIKDVADKLKSAHEMKEKVIYIEALCHVGSRSVLPYVAPYVYGTAKEIQSWEDSDIDFLKTVTLYALHNVVGYYPKEMLKYVIPVYFNLTEVPRVRTAAFSVLIRAQPPLSLLQHVAQDSWIEPSNEVGSYVYSTVRTYGNSSEPCFQLTAQRIKLVISQFKNYDIGRQHARSIVRDFFDRLRNFGVQYKTAYTPSNETFIPHTLFASVNYNIQNLKDVLWQFAFNIQGVPEEDILKYLDAEILEGRWPKDIPSGKQNQIFGSLKILPRMPKELRMTIYRKFFYAGDYWYLDAETISDVLQGMVEHMKNVFMTRGEIKGHCVKVFIPSSYHSFSIGRIAATPIEFSMKHPLLMSVAVKGKIMGRGSNYAVEYDIKNNWYQSSHKYKHVINPADRKAYGVYHEQKFAYTLPFTFYLHYNYQNNTLIMSFKFPELPLRFLRYETEAGTYVGDVKLSQLPSSDNRDTIRTIPTLFKKEKYWGCENLLPVHFVSHSEDITDYVEDVPSNGDEALELLFKYLRNPGWRKKSINGTMVRDQKCNVDTLTIAVSYNNTQRYPNMSSRNSRSSMERDEEDQYQSESEEQQSRPSRQWARQWSSGKEDYRMTESKAKNLYESMRYRLPHTAHELALRVITGPSVTKAHLRMEYNHTQDLLTHTYMFAGKVDPSWKRQTYEFCLSHAMEYPEVPNEFEYDHKTFESQRADFYTALNLKEWKMFANADIVAQGSLNHIPHEELFHRHEFTESPRKEWFLPETYEECKDDIKEGKPLSMDCMKVMKEESYFNRYQVKVEWNKGSRSEIPAILRNITYKVEHAMKHAFYGHSDINRIDVQNPKSTVEVTVDYINKLVDTPVVNVYVQTPEENIHFHKLDAEYMMPLSSLYRFRENSVSYLTNNTYPPTCALMEKYLRTFDVRTYRLPEDQCTYVVATHCTEDKKFAVLAKHLSTSEKEIKVYVENYECIMKPSHSQGVYSLQFNGQSYTVSKDKAVLLDRSARIHAFVLPVSKGKHQLVLHADNAGVYVKYDGKNVKIQVTPLYKGKLCGLCSEFDGEYTREYRGVDQCLYTDSFDFAHSAIVDAQQCGVDTTPKKPVMCFSDESYPHNDYSDRHSSSQSRSSRPKPQTINVARGEFICFSTQPVPTCEENSEPDQIQRKKVEYHCLPKYDSTTKRLLEESQRRVLRELSNKSVDFTETISVPRSCSE